MDIIATRKSENFILVRVEWTVLLIVQRLYTISETSIEIRIPRCKEYPYQDQMHNDKSPIIMELNS